MQNSACFEERGTGKGRRIGICEIVDGMLCVNSFEFCCIRFRGKLSDR